ncbi:hypothetical protein [Salinibacter altiplanensis]|uniref:hypothetical protein n=1 Tax=Salinibacter altiplanensis TaxID=1803181 RepID=UPI000C9FC8E7|nr:hypothetical protein [Salinibacter altiplanensis]
MSTSEENHDWPIRGRFRKKYQPYAVRICEETLGEIAEYEDCKVVTDYETEEVRIKVQTSEGTLRALWGDWIAEDSQDEHYPVSHDEFRRIYEPIE